MGEGSLFLEERQFQVAGEPSATIVEAVRPLLFHAAVAARIEAQLAILNDDDLAWFARYGLSIQARNVLDDKTK